MNIEVFRLTTISLAIVASAAVSGVATAQLYCQDSSPTLHAAIEGRVDAKDVYENSGDALPMDCVVCNGANNFVFTIWGGATCPIGSVLYTGVTRIVPNQSISMAVPVLSLLGTLLMGASLLGATVWRIRRKPLGQ